LCPVLPAQSSPAPNGDRIATPGSTFRPLEIEVSPEPTSAGAPNPDLTAFSMPKNAWDDLLLSDVDDIAKRPAHRLPKIGDGVSAPTKPVNLHHPGYPNDEYETTLLILPTCSINTEKQPCAEYWLAWQACYVLAIENNGFFTAERERDSARIAHGQGLVEGNCWHHLDVDADDNEEPYATLQSFRAWRYKEETMPPSWSSAVPWKGSFVVPWTGRQDDDHQDNDCCLTGEDFATKALVVPTTELEWWNMNHMVYIAAAESGVRMEPESMAVPGNSIPLSPTLHRIWDNDHFSLFPLKVSEGGNGGCIASLCVRCKIWYAFTTDVQ
jgi:hypothetical protein